MKPYNLLIAAGATLFAISLTAAPKPKRVKPPENRVAFEGPLPTIQVQRFASNPLITSKTPRAGSNIYSPSVIRVPDWVTKPLGRYYLYYGRHRSSSIGGATIKFAYADSPEGPWTVHTEPALRRTELKDVKNVDGKWIDVTTTREARKKQHIASPDVHVDNENKRIIMYFHGSYRGHGSGAAVSSNGLTFVDENIGMGPPYLRVVRQGSQYYGFSPDYTNGPGGALARKLNGPFGPSQEPGVLFAPTTPEDGRLRHLAVLAEDNRFIVFHCRQFSTPERIQASVIKVVGDDMNKWQCSAPIEVIRPDHPYEGSTRPVKKSKPGTGQGVHELRDPCIFMDTDGQKYLYYCIQGEAGIAGSKLTIK